MLETLFGKSPTRRAMIGGLSDYERPQDFLIGYMGGRQTRAGVQINETTAMTYAAVWCATRIITEGVSGLPFITYERTAGDDRTVATDYPLYDLLKNSPNSEMSDMPFWEGRVQHQVNWGGGFAEIVRERDDPNARPVELIPIHAGRVCKPQKSDEAMGYRYLVRNNDGSSVLMMPYEMLHIPGVLSDDGIWGKGVIQWARESIGAGLATERHGATYFGGGAQPRGIITGLNVKDKEARKTFREEWKELHGSPDAKEIAILPPGADFKAIQISNEDSQFLQTRVHNTRDVARWYRVPLHMLMDMEKANYASIEINSLEFVIYHLWPWLKRIQGQCNLKLIPKADRGRYYTEHLLASLLRGDLKSRIDSYRVGIGIGIYTINECRRFENLSGIGPAGDVHYVPANMTTTEVMLTNPPQPSLGGTPGSDQIGGAGKESEMLAKLDALLTHAQRDELNGHLKAIESNGNGHDDWKPGVRKAARGLMRAALTRWFTKESNAAKRAAKSENFQAWSDDFYGKHFSTLTEEIEPTAALLNSIGVTMTAGEIAGRVISESKNRISAALNASPATLLTSLETWPTERAEQTSADIFNE